MLYGAMNSPLKPLLDEMKAIAALKFDYLELAMDPPYCDSRNLKEQQPHMVEALKQYNLGLVCHLPTFLSTADLTYRIRQASVEETLASLEVAAELKPLKVVLHPSYVTGLGAFLPELTRQYAMESLEIFVRKAQALGLCLCLENMIPRTQWLVNPEEFVDVLDKFPTLKLLLDIGHAHINDPKGKKCLRFIEMFSDRIGHLHVSDHFGKEDQHLPIGEGVIHFSKIAAALKAIGYDDTITLEVFTGDRDDLKVSKLKMEAIFRES